MPISYHIDSSRGVVFTTASDSFTVDEPLAHVASFDLAHKTDLGGYSLALVVADDAAFGLARMYQQITEENLPHVGVFRSIEEAAAWLGVA